MKQNETYCQLIPEKVLEALPGKVPFFEHISGYSTDRLKQVISIIAFNIRKDKEDWTPLKIVYMRAIVPQADQYLDILWKQGIVERSKKAKKEVISYKYSFTEQFQSTCIKLPLTSPKIINRITKYRTSMKKRNSKMYPDQNKYLSQMTIDPEALLFADKTYSDRLSNLNKSVSTLRMDIKRKEEENDILRWYNYGVASVTKILNGDIYKRVDTTSGRYHSNLTNLPKELRQFIRIDGERLVNIDVKNSQPYLSTLILTNPSRVAEFTKNTHFSMLLRSLQVIHTEDIKKYISLVVNGKFYEYLIEEFEKRGVEFKSVEFQDKRDEVKKKLMVILFSKNSVKPKYRRIFAELFPEVHRVFSIVRGNAKSKDKFHNYKRFAILLQRIESRLILDKVLGRIYKEHPDIIAVTIHDSVMTDAEEEHIRIVHRIMEEELQKFVGFRPKLKIEDHM